MADVVHLNVVTTLDTPPEQVVNAVPASDLEQVVVIGSRKDGSLYFASSTSDGGNVLWLFEVAKHQLMKLADPDEGR